MSAYMDVPVSAVSQEQPARVQQLVQDVGSMTPPSMIRCEQPWANDELFLAIASRAVRC